MFQVTGLIVQDYTHNHWNSVKSLSQWLLDWSCWPFDCVPGDGSDRARLHPQPQPLELGEVAVPVAVRLILLTCLIVFQVTGLIVQDYTHNHSHWNSVKSLSQWLLDWSCWPFDCVPGDGSDRARLQPQPQPLELGEVAVAVAVRLILLTIWLCSRWRVWSCKTTTTTTATGTRWSRCRSGC